MRIAFFGDSFVNGTGDPAYLGWVGRVCARARARGDDLTAYNCGIRRATSADAAATWQAEATARLPAAFKCAVVFSFGANDRVVENGMARVSLAQQIETTRAILGNARARWPVVFIAAPDTGSGEAARERVQTTQKLCAELGVPFLDAFTASLSFKHWRAEAAAGDGVHPGSLGYEEFAAVVDAWPAWGALLGALRA